MRRLTVLIEGRPKRWKRPEERTFRGRTTRYVDPEVEKETRRIRAEVRKRWGSAPPWTGPLALRALFVFAIPPSWPKRVREAALDGQVWHIADPDFDQLLKLVMDALRGLVYVDDNQMVGMLPGSAKRYGRPERTEIEIALLNQPEGAVTPGQRRLEAKQAERAADLKSGKLGRSGISPKAKSPKGPTKGFAGEPPPFLNPGLDRAR